MRSLILLLLSFSFVTSLNAQVKKVKRKGVDPMKIKPVNKPADGYGLSHVTGKWQEMRRTLSKNNTSLAFIDSLQIHITSDSNAIVRDGIHFAVEGNVDFDKPNLAHIAGDTYSILKADGKELVIDDGKEVHYMRKTAAFYSESFGKIMVKPETFENPITPDVSKLQGKWFIYRREAPPGTSHDDHLLRFIDIKVNADNSLKAEIGYYDRDASQSGAGTVALVNNELQIVMPAHTWVVNVYKADGEEFVFGEKGRMMNYAKKL